jgi:hypothetical protein
MKFRELLSVLRDVQFVNAHYNNGEVCRTKNNFNSSIYDLEVVLVAHNVDCLEVWLK